MKDKKVFALLISIPYLFTRKKITLKLRVTHNSIRIRVQKSELAQFLENERIEEQVNFPTGTALKFGLATSEENSIQANYTSSGLVIQIPRSTAMEWGHSNQVGIEARIPLDSEASLHVLIEKDFPCLDRPNEDKSETFWELAQDPNKNC